MTHWLAIGLVLLLTGASLATASVLRDRGVAPPVTRWVAATVGGLAYLVAVLWLDTWSAVALSALSLLLIAVLRARRSSLLKGLRWSTAEESRAELGYPAAATIALAAGLPAGVVAGGAPGPVPGRGGRPTGPGAGAADVPGRSTVVGRRQW